MVQDATILLPGTVTRRKREKLERYDESMED